MDRIKRERLKLLAQQQKELANIIHCIAMIQKIDHTLSGTESAHLDELLNDVNRLRESIAETEKIVSEL